MKADCLFRAVSSTLRRIIDADKRPLLQAMAGLADGGCIALQSSNLWSSHPASLSIGVSHDLD